MRVILLLLSLAAFSQKAASSVLLQEDFEQINQSDKPNGVGFIVPNEDHFYLFNSALKNKKDVLIGVGTFRFFHDAAMGDFSYVISLDHSKQVINFNTGLINILKASGSRHQFLENLLGNNQFGYVLRRYEAGLLSDEKFKEIAEAQISKYQFENAKNDYKILQFFPNKVAPEELKAFSLKMLDFLLSPQKRRSTFLGSDRLYDKVKSLADGNRIILVNGSLTFGPTIRDLSNILVKQGLKVSVLNISNIHSGLYIPPNEIFLYLKNIAQIPFSSDASILVTQSTDQKLRVKLGIWTYHSVPAVDYLKGVDAITFDSFDSNLQDKFYGLLRPGQYQLYFQTLVCGQVFSQ